MMRTLRYAVLATFFLSPTFATTAFAGDPVPLNDPLPPGAVARLGSTRLRHTSVLKRIAFMPDGKSLIAAAKSICVWDAVTGRLIIEADKESEDMVLAPDGKRLAWTGGGVHFMDVATGRELLELDGHRSFCDAVAFSPDGKELASVGRDDMIRFWDPTTGKVLGSLACPRSGFLAYLPGGKTLISDSERDCLLWNLETKKVLRRWEKQLPMALTLDGKFLVTAPDGELLLRGAVFPQLQLWDISTGKELRRFDLPKRKGGTGNRAAHCAAFSHDGKLLAAADLTDCVHVWEVSTGKELYRARPHQTGVTCLAFSPDGKTLAIGAWQTILLWESTTGKELLANPGNDEPIYHVEFAPDGKTVITDSKVTKFWDVRTGAETGRFREGHTICAFAPDGGRLTRGKGSIIWSLPADRSCRTFKLFKGDHPDKVSGLEFIFSRDGKLMASGSYDRTVRIWNQKTGELRWEAYRKEKDFPNPTDGGGHFPLGFTRDGKALISLGDDKLLRFLDLATGKETRCLQVDFDRAALSPDGRFLASFDRSRDDQNVWGPDKLPQLWDLTKDEEKPHPVELYPKLARFPAFSPDGKTVALADGSEVVVLDCLSLKELHRFKGHRGEVYALAFSPDGQLLVSGSNDLTSLVWKIGN